MTEQPWAQLGEAIGAIREELQRAEEGGRGKPLTFRTGPVELEFSVEVRNDGKGRAKVFVLPWTVEGEAGTSRGRVHRIKLTLHPIDEHGKDKVIADHDTERPK